jgi:tight adherence protein B
VTAMLDPLLIQILVALLAAGAVFLFAYVALYPFLSGDRTSERVEGVTQGSGAKTQRRAAGPANEALNTRKKQVQDTIKDMEAREKAKKKVSLRVKLQRAGLDASPQQFWIASAVVGVAAGVVVLITGSSLLISLLAAFGAGLGLPQYVLNFLAKRRQNKFLQEFANAIDVVVRGVKSGLPLNDCLGIIARESPEPIASEFSELIEQQRVGVPLAECFERMMVRIPLQDVNFFAIVIAIQQQAGGNLSEALGNLSGVLRDRKRMDAKVKALSAEAKASAMILAALPFTVMLGVYFTTPSYIAILWQERVGHFMLAGAGFWMTCGLLVMRKMINFKY